jgi:DNA-binding NarL/FixJ family response regulator
MCALLSSRANFNVVLELPNIPEDMDILLQAQPDILLFHTSGGVSDLEVLSRVCKLTPKIKVLLMLDEPDEEIEFRAIKAGAHGCVSKAIDLDTLFKAIDLIGRGELWISRPKLTRLIGKFAQSDSADRTTLNGLTGREWEILALLAGGSRNKEIANRLSLSENTVKTHLNTIYRKINVDCRLAATLYYFERAKSDRKLPPQI